MDDEDPEVLENEQSEKDDEEPVSLNDYGSASTGKKIHKPPTGEELREIKEAKDLFRWNSFKFRVSTTPAPSSSSSPTRNLSNQRSTHYYPTSVPSHQGYLHWTA